MKKKILGMLLLCILLIFISCEQKSEKDVFMVVGSDGTMLSEAAQKLESPEKYGLYTSSEQVELKNVDKKIMFAFDNNEYLYQYSDCYMKSLSATEYGDFYSIYDEYSGKEGLSLKMLHGTDFVTHYVNSNAIDRTVYSVSQNSNYKSYNYTDEQIKTIADEFLQSFLDKAKYEDFDFSINRQNGAYSILYLKYIHGYMTDEYLWITINNKGQIMGYNGQYFGKYDTLSSFLSKEKLDRAKEKLTNKIDSMNLDSCKKADPQIVTNRSGDVFMEMGYTFMNGYTESAEKIIVAVK